ncbi:MAG: hypothetical protein WBV55_02835 [Candidatus Sulfotelmatobacter sp.]
MKNMSDDDLRASNNDYDENNDNDRQQHQGSCQSWDGEALDRELNAALAQDAAVEPRPGLEERILANLSAERKQASAQSWWQWGAVAAVAAMLLVSSTVLWRLGETPGRHSQALNSKQANATDARQATINGGIDQTPLSPPALSREPAARIRRRSTGVVTASGPRLDQFPSPRPLSEQERILERYVAKYPEHAALVARARAEALRQDLAEEMKRSAASRGSEQ